MLLSLANVLLVTKAIGPAHYGVYAAALGILGSLYNVAQLGIGVYLIRREGSTEQEDYDQAFTLLALIGGTLLILTIALAPWLALLTGIRELAFVGKALFPGVVLQLVALVPLARLERTLAYRMVAAAELAGQVAYLLVAVPLAWLGVGVWAPVTGWWAQQASLCGLLYRLSRYRPRFHFNKKRVRDMLGYSLGYSASVWIWQLRALVNPLVVGRFVGAEAVGVVALTIRIIEMLSVVKSAAWRLSIAALAKLQNDRSRLLRALEEGMRLQVLALGPVFFVFSLVAPWLLDVMLGGRWAGVMTVLPFIAFAYLINAMFNMHSSALYVCRRNWDVAQFHLFHVGLFMGSAWLTVPRLGIVGYGWAEIIALLSYLVLHAHVSRQIGWPSYRSAAIWAGAFGVAAFWPHLGAVTALPLLGVLAWPGTWGQLRDYWYTLRRLSHG